MIDGFRCTVCGADEARSWRHDGEWTVVRCKGCGVLRTWPLPSEDTLRAMYDDMDYYDARAWDGTARQAWLERGEQIIALLGYTPGAMLDFGAGPGRLVGALREMGIAAEGVEWSQAACAHALQESGVELEPVLREDWGERFDAVTMLHSLEHVEDPVALLGKLRGTLRPGGAIFIEVPHAASMGMHRPVRRARILDLPLHVHHFTPDTLSEAVTRAGLVVSDVRLFNSPELEQLLSLRSHLRSLRSHLRRGAAAAKSANGDGHATASPAANNGSATAAPSESPSEQAAWRRSLLATLRRRMAGDTFQLIARSS